MSAEQDLYRNTKRALKGLLPWYKMPRYFVQVTLHREKKIW